MPADIWPQAVLDLLAADPGRAVFEDGERIFTAGEMSALIRRITAGLRTAGAGPGTGVALELGVTAEAFAATIAAFAVGARVSGIRPGQSPLNSPTCSAATTRCTSTTSAWPSWCRRRTTAAR